MSIIRRVACYYYFIYLNIIIICKYKVSMSITQPILQSGMRHRTIAVYKQVLTKSLRSTRSSVSRILPMSVRISEWLQLRVRLCDGFKDILKYAISIFASLYTHLLLFHICIIYNTQKSPSNTAPSMLPPLSLPVPITRSNAVKLPRVYVKVPSRSKLITMDVASQTPNSRIYRQEFT